MNDNSTACPVNGRKEWEVVVSLLRKTDGSLLRRVLHKMLNHLCCTGAPGATKLLKMFGPTWDSEDDDTIFIEANEPCGREALPQDVDIEKEIFEIATRHLNDSDILGLLHRWIREDKSLHLINSLENLDTSLTEIGDEMARYEEFAKEDRELSLSAARGIRVSLVRRFFSDQLQFIRVAKNFVDIRDYHELYQRMIYPAGSHGRVGGKGAGLFLAMQILKRAAQSDELLKNIRIPKTWFVVSDTQRNFIYRNNLEDVFSQKYKDIHQVREEYPYIIQLFKNSSFPIEIIKGLSMALDDFGDVPLIVRSSSLLEDRFGTSFSGKYKSLYLANQGTKQERLSALVDAVAEVYASIFSPDPIEYRVERGLLDYHEEMGVLIQEVVGTHVAHYHLPAFAGVAFSRNEMRWSPRIRREDGLVRLVPGLGTRAVDRLGDDYPILIAPGQPGLRASVSIDEIVRYAPHKMDVVNLARRRFETVDAIDFYRKYGDRMPWAGQLISIFDHDRLRKPMGGMVDFDNDDLVITFDGLLDSSPFTRRMKVILNLLEDTLQTPVDLEFASTGEDFVLLQCRPQSFSRYSYADPIPRNVPAEQVVFSAEKFVSNGPVPDISHVVYVDPDGYSELSDLPKLNMVGRIVSRLNEMLPKRKFILMGPGRWGSRGDIRLGVKVTYSDINNTAMLIEIAKKKGNYVPDLSFGTHFFQDLVESSIRYLPLYPDDAGIAFNEDFFDRTENSLTKLIPDAGEFTNVVRVIDVPSVTGGNILRVLLNADSDEALAMLAPGGQSHWAEPSSSVTEGITDDGGHWRWRMRMAERVATLMEPERFGVKAMYIFGSTKNATAGPESDINLIIHFEGTDAQKNDLCQWLEGWCLCLAETNFMRTGYRVDRILDYHLVTDQDIADKTGYATRIDAITDAPRPLVVGKAGVTKEA